MPADKPTELSRIKLENLNSTARPYDQRAFSPLDPTAFWHSHLALAIYMFVVVNFRCSGTGERYSNKKWLHIDLFTCIETMALSKYVFNIYMWLEQIFKSWVNVQFRELELFFFKKKGALFQEEFYLSRFFRPPLTNWWYDFLWMA